MNHCLKTKSGKLLHAVAPMGRLSLANDACSCSGGRLSQKNKRSSDKAHAGFKSDFEAGLSHTPSHMVKTQPIDFL